MVVDLSAADEEVGVGMEVADLMFEFESGEDGLLAGDGSGVNGIGAADFEAGVEAIEGAGGDIGAGGDAEVVSVEYLGVDARAADESRELEALGCCGCSLGVRGARKEESRGDDGEAQAGFQWLHPRLNLRLARRDRPRMVALGRSRFGWEKTRPAVLTRISYPRFIVNRGRRLEGEALECGLA